MQKFYIIVELIKKFIYFQESEYLYIYTLIYAL